MLLPKAFAQSNLEFFFGKTQSTQNATITKVITADTIELDTGETIKLIGVKALEVHRKKGRIERDKYGFEKKGDVSAEIPLETRLLEDATALLQGKSIRLEYDARTKDEALNTLAYAFFKDSNSMINATLLELGLCNLQIRIPNIKYRELLRAAYQKGRSEQEGIHGQH
ncbi:thermonuclease family protein [Candidatus Omnitrophota bacterium]